LVLKTFEFGEEKPIFLCTILKLTSFGLGMQ